MTIELQTGLPGACKTQYTLWRVENLRRKTQRPVFYSGIPINSEKLPDWQPIEADKWFTAPPESIVVIDEAQRLFRPRPNGSAVPPYESALETHRHGGIDLVLITQHPRLLSVGVRTLVGRHMHAVRHYGAQWSTIHEWPECRLAVENRRDSSRTEFKFKREVFDWYKSSEAHTIKTRIPQKVWLLLGLITLSAVLGWRLWASIAGRASSSAPAAVSAAASSPFGSPAAPVAGALTAAQYVELHRPRVDGLAYTAPAYDEVTKPVHAPYPAACIQSATRCRCYTQQATRLDVPEGLCRGIAQGGFFLAWAQPVPAAPPVQPAALSPADAAVVVPASFGIHGAGTQQAAAVASPDAPVEQDPARPRVRR